ncbi:hypothetical protein PAECIP111802_06749 [Paenibacillus allorhizosphaerae]|uniref:Extracellular solute-binding protein n=2 Tax=Paenibacillus allorhizosphaerae TaxID=2849866 RepID=A0ABM8VT85_9BACL|nr:hypothetical protein PAECIP111802_06749 [Paenibacillus allorhizosphaerae]
MIKKLMITLLMIVYVVVFTGCGEDKGTAGKESLTEKHDPVTVTVGAQFLTEEEFSRYITEPVKKKYPWITVKDVRYVSGRSLPELITSGETPDLVIHHNIGGMQQYLDLDLTYPLTDMIKKYNMDLSRFEPEALEAVKAATSRDDLVGLPYTRHFSALYYNKDIFDKFGVEHPKDGMTWDEVYQLARKVTRVVDNVQFRGLEPNVTERPASQLSLPYVDPKTHKALINTEQWKKVLEFMLKIHQIPGNEQITYHGAANDLFAKNQTLAMLASNNILFEGNLYKFPELNWNMVSYPAWPEAPGKSLRIDQHMLSITKSSKNPDAAFLVIATVTSDEVQMDLSAQGRLSILKDKKIRDAFGANLDFIKGKNIQALYKTTPAKSFAPTKYDGTAMSTINDALKDAVTNGKDVNTVLREAEEKLNQKIRQLEESK